MKLLFFMRGNALCTLLLLVSLVESRPQGYYYPAPSNSSTTSPLPSTTSTEVVTTSSQDNSTTPFSGYIIEGKEEFSGIAERLNSATSQETATNTPQEPDPSISSSSSSDVSTEQPDVPPTEENSVLADGAEKGNDETTEPESKDNTEKDEQINKNKTEDNSVTKSPEEESTTLLNDMETTTLLDAPYPPSGQRPSGRDFSYDVQDLFPGRKVSEQAVLSPPPESVSNDATKDSYLDPRAVAPPNGGSTIPTNRLANQVQFSLTSSGPRPYYYQPPPQKLQNNYFPQQQQTNRNFYSQRFVPSYPSNSYSQPAPYPPARVDYDQRFGSSNVVARSSLPPPASYREYQDRSPYDFAYDVRVAPYGPFFGHQENRRGSETQGRYYVVQPDGRLRVVRYEAGSGGFRPSISHEPTLDYQDYQ